MLPNSHQNWNFIEICLSSLPYKASPKEAFCYINKTTLLFNMSSFLIWKLPYSRRSVVISKLFSTSHTKIHFEIFRLLITWQCFSFLYSKQANFLTRVISGDYEKSISIQNNLLTKHIRLKELTIKNEAQINSTISVGWQFRFWHKVFLKYYATFKMRNTCLQKTTTCIGLQSEQLFSVNI